MSEEQKQTYQAALEELKKPNPLTTMKPAKRYQPERPPITKGKRGI